MFVPFESRSDPKRFAGSILQLAVIYYAKQADMRSFERTFAQLRPLFAAFRYDLEPADTGGRHNFGCHSMIPPRPAHTPYTLTLQPRDRCCCR